MATEKVLGEAEAVRESGTIIQWAARTPCGREQQKPLIPA